MKWGKIATLIVLVLAACTTPSRPLESGVSMVLHGGRIYTGNPAAPFAEAIAIEGTRVKRIGASAEILALATAGTDLVDLHGRLVVPGFIDSHVHFDEGGAELLAPDLRTARSARELGERLGAAARTLPAGAWIRHGSWDHQSWGGVLPTRSDIDALTPSHPVFVNRLDGHMALANSAALRIAGITRDTKDPDGGTIVRDAAGEPTGILKDHAMNLVASHLPAPTKGELRAAIVRALEHAASLGVTGVHDMGTSREVLEVFRELRDEGRLSLRLTAYLAIGAETPKSARELRKELGDASWITIGGVKAFADGSLGSSTALFKEPYADQPAERGLSLADLASGGRLETQVIGFCGELFQPAIHAIGDRANNEVLDLYRRVDRAASHPFHPPFREFRIEHAQHLWPTDIGRFGRYGVVASMQPYHAIDDGRWCEPRIGAERCKTTYAFRSLLDQGATLAFGSDWPVAPLSPLLGIDAAVNRRTLDGRHPEGWVPEQKISVEEALRAYTQGSARAAMASKDSGLGRLIAGGVADLAVLDHDIMKTESQKIARTSVVLTMVDGRVVFRGH